MRSLTDAYNMMYEKDNRSPSEIQAAENEYDAFEAETGGDGDMDEWRKKRAAKAAKPKSTAERMAAAHDKNVIDRLNKYSKNENVEVYKSLTDAYSSMYEKKKECKDGYHYDKDEKKCVKDKKSSKTTIIVGRGYGGHHHDHDDGEDGNEGGGGEGGGTGGGDGGGGGGE